MVIFLWLYRTVKSLYNANEENILDEDTQIMHIELGNEWSAANECVGELGAMYRNDT